MTTTFAVVHQAQATSLTLRSEISLPWRMLAMGICLFGSADIVAREGLSGGATAMFFSAYCAFAAAMTMLCMKAER